MQDCRKEKKMVKLLTYFYQTNSPYKLQLPANRMLELFQQHPKKYQRTILQRLENIMLFIIKKLWELESFNFNIAF